MRREEICGITSGKRGREREAWWWNEDVQRCIKEKKIAFNQWQRSGTPADKHVYKNANKRAKRAVAASKDASWAELAESLSRSDGQNKMFKLAKQARKERKDLVGCKFVRGTDDSVKTEDEEIRDTWKEYYTSLLNQENPNVIEDTSPVLGPIQEVTEQEVRVALKGMKPGKAAGPSGVTVELLKVVGDPMIKELKTIFNGILHEALCPEEWTRSLTLPLYKGKGDPLSCGNYRGLRLLEHGMKIWEKILAARLGASSNIHDSQFGFMPGKSTTDAIFCLRHVQALYMAKHRPLYHVFVDLEKAFDRIPRTAITWALRRQGIPEQLVRAIIQLYVGSTTRVLAAGGLSEELGLSVGVHQGSTLSPLLFNLVMEEATKECTRQAPWSMLYADDLVLTAETWEEVVEEFKRWKMALERRGMKVNMNKTKIMVTGKESVPIRSGRYPCGVCGRGVCGRGLGVNSVLCVQCNLWCHKRCSGLQSVTGTTNFICPSCVRGNSGSTVVDSSFTIDGSTVAEVSSFCYLGDMFGPEGGAERTVKMRVAIAWSKWRELAGLLRNRSIPLKNRAAVYDSCVRSALLYASETWPLTQHLETTIRSCDRRMIRMLTGTSLTDRVSSDELLRRCGLSDVIKVISVRRLSWYGHVARRSSTEELGRVFCMEVEGRRPRGRPKKTWMNCVEQDLAKIHALKKMP